MADNINVGAKIDFSSARKAASDLKGLESGWKKQKKTAAASMDAIRNKVGSVTKSLFSMKNMIIGFAGFKAFQGLKNQVLGMTAAYETQIAAEKRLGMLLGNTGVNVQARLQQLKDWASATQKQTVYGDEQILSLQQQALAMGVSQDKLEEFTLAAMRLSGATGMSLDSATKNLAKTYGGLAGELGEVIPELREMDAEMMKSGAAVDLINRKFAGFEKEGADRATGGLKRLSNVIGDIREKIGERLDPVIAKIAGRLRTWFEANEKIIAQKIGDALEKAFQNGERLVQVMIDLIPGAIGAAEALAQIGGTIAKIVGWMQEMKVLIPSLFVVAGLRMAIASGNPLVGAGIIAGSAVAGIGMQKYLDSQAASYRSSHNVNINLHGANTAQIENSIVDSVRPHARRTALMQQKQNQDLSRIRTAI